MQPAFTNCGCPVLTSQWTVQILKSSLLGCHHQFHFLVEMPRVCIQLTLQDRFMSPLWKFGSLFTFSLLGCHHFSRPVEIPWKCVSTSAFLLLSMQLIVSTQLTLKNQLLFSKKTGSMFTSLFWPRGNVVIPSHFSGATNRAPYWLLKTDFHFRLIGSIPLRIHGPAEMWPYLYMLHTWMQPQVSTQLTLKTGSIITFLLTWIPSIHVPMKMWS